MTMTASEGLVAFLESLLDSMRPAYFDDLMTAASSMSEEVLPCAPSPTLPLEQRAA